MDIKESVITKIRERTLLAVPVSDDSDLFADLGFDSLSFVTLLVDLEDEYGVTFGIDEMESCLKAGQLTALLGRKVKKADR